MGYKVTVTERNANPQGGKVYAVLASDAERFNSLVKTGLFKNGRFKYTLSYPKVILAERIEDFFINSITGEKLDLDKYVLCTGYQVVEESFN